MSADEDAIIRRIYEEKARLDYRQLKALTAPQLLALDLPPQEALLEPWLFEMNLVMVHAKRGVGKTHFALGCAAAIASGTSFLSFKAPKSRGVLFVDGEMTGQAMQSRVREISSAIGEAPEQLRIVTPSLQSKAMPDLGTLDGQLSVDELVTPETKLIILDNLSALVRGGSVENEAESWTLVAEWALEHRRAGRSVLFVHHSGKSGAQRGTSKREDLLDVVVALRHPPEYQEQDGAVFSIHFEKARSLTGDDIAPIEARLEDVMGSGPQWTWRGVAGLTYTSAKDLWELGTLSLTDIARELGINKSNVARALQKAMEAGELKRPYPAKRQGKAAPEVARNQPPQPRNATDATR